MVSCRTSAKVDIAPAPPRWYQPGSPERTTEQFPLSFATVADPARASANVALRTGPEFAVSRAEKYIGMLDMKSLIVRLRYPSKRFSNTGSEQGVGQAKPLLTDQAMIEARTRPNRVCVGIPIVGPSRRRNPDSSPRVVPRGISQFPFC